MRRRFFVDGFQNGFAILSGETAHHLGRVLRVESGQMYELSDGETAWLARTDSVGRDGIRFTLIERLGVHPAPVKITLLLAVVKFDRFEWAIEKATELGVDKIIPLASDRSEKGLLSAAAKRAERWRRILTESAQQARRLRVPELREVARPRDAFHDSAAQVRLLLSERMGATAMRDLLEPAAAAPGGGEAARVDLAIGPEGGWTDVEFSAAESAGYGEASLGNNILRTETAVCAALAAVQYAFGAFRDAGHSAHPQAETHEEEV